MGLADFFGISREEDALQRLLCERATEQAYVIYRRLFDPRNENQEPLIPLELPNKRAVFELLVSHLYLSSVALLTKISSQKILLEVSRQALFAKKMWELTEGCTKELPKGVLSQRIGHLNEHEEAVFAARVGDAAYMAYWRLRKFTRPSTAREFFFGLHAELFAQQVLLLGLDYHKDCVPRIMLLQREALEFAKNLWHKAREGTVAPTDLFANLPGLDSSTLDRAGES